MDRLRHLVTMGCVALLALGAAACGGKGGNGAVAVDAASSRVAAVPSENDPKAAESFCDKHWPGEGATTMPFSGGPARKDIGGKPLAAVAGEWRWVNFWATWCAPCLEEMPLLGRWRDALQKEGLGLSLELWSVDEDETKLRQRVAQGAMPGPVQWVEGPTALATYLQKLGMDPDSMLPIHMLVDPNDKLRCVRIGAVGANDYGVVRKLLGR